MIHQLATFNSFEIINLIMQRYVDSYSMNSRFLLFSVIAASLLTSACHPSVQKVMTTAGRPTVVSPPVRMPSDSTNEVFTQLHRLNAVINVYSSRRDSLVWVGDSSVTATGDSLVELIRGARYYGLLPGNYHADEIDSLYQGGRVIDSRRMDALLTDSFLTILMDLKWGRTTDFRPSESDSLVIALMSDVLAGKSLKETVQSQEPKFKSYVALKTTLRNILDTLGSKQRYTYASAFPSDTLLTSRYLRAIEINLERWRRERVISGDEYLLVNIPSNVLTINRCDSVVFESKVITGKRNSPTPELSSKIDCFILFPYWHVPRKIAVNEYLPAIKIDSTFLSRNRFDILDREGNLVDPSTIAWETLNRNNFPLTIRQREGSDNSLGIVKFAFDNPYAVYLHDTNTKGLFTKNRRWFSHGCVRVQKAKELAHYLSTRDAKLEDARLTRLLREGKRQTLLVDPAFPVHIRYFTCEVDAGELKLYDDVYRKDAAIAQKLYGHTVAKN